MIKVNLPNIIGKGYGSFWRDKSFYEVVKGGRASKKSTTMAIRSIYRIMKYPLSNMVVVRQVYSTHKNSTFAELKKAAKRLNVYDKWKFVESPYQCTYLPTGQKILFYGFDDPMKLTSLTVDTGYLCWAWFEEVFEIDNMEDFDTFVEGIRGQIPAPLFKQVTLTYNPWINSHWTKTRFWDCECPPDTFRLTTTHKCNEFLDEQDHERIEVLKDTNPARYKVVGLGEYGMPGGTFFDEFREDVHVIKPFSLEPGHRLYRVLDYGLDKLACYWVDVDFQNKAKFYKEVWESNLIISQAAKRILDMTLPSEQIYQTIAPPDLWNRRQDTGKSAAQIFQENGIYLTMANNDFEQGCLDLKEWLAPYDTKDEQTGEIIKTANLQVTSNCIHLINSLSSITQDEKRPNVYAKEPHDLTHSVDALRYYVSGRPYPPKPTAQRKSSIWQFETKKEEGGFLTW